VASLDVASEGHVPEVRGLGHGNDPPLLQGRHWHGPRLAEVRDSAYMVGVVVAANRGARKRFSVLDVPIEELLTAPELWIRAGS